MRSAGTIRAVDGVDLRVRHGEVLAVVGESGCGKTTLARAIVGLQPATAGAIRFMGKPIGSLQDQERRFFHRSVQMVFQDPFDSLNPRKSIFRTVAQPLKIHRIVERRDIRKECSRLLELVGLAPAHLFLDRFPHQLSVGQRQRACIARAVASRPSLLVADEAVSALDISIRAQVLKLMKELQAALVCPTCSLLTTSRLIRSLADRAIVMYLGQVVEEGTVDEILFFPEAPLYPSAT